MGAIPDTAFTATTSSGIVIMLVLLLSSLVGLSAAGPVADADASPHYGYGGYGYHGYHGPPCTYEHETETKEICYYKPEKTCETKSETYTVVTGYEDGDCKEIMVCKFDLHGGYRKRRAADPNAEPFHGYHGYGYHGYHGCAEEDKEAKEVCKKVPIKEEKTNEFDVCRFEPVKVCEDKEVAVPKLVCEEPAEEEADE